MKFSQLENVEEFPRWACVIARYRVLEFRRNRFRDRLVLNEKVFDLLLEEASNNILIWNGPLPTSQQAYEPTNQRQADKTCIRPLAWEGGP